MNSLDASQTLVSVISRGFPSTGHRVRGTGRAKCPSKPSSAPDYNLLVPHLSRLPPTALSEDLLLRRSALSPFSPLFRLSSSLRLRRTCVQASHQSARLC